MSEQLVALWTAGPRAELSGWLVEAVAARPATKTEPPSKELAGGGDPTVGLSRWLVGVWAGGHATRTEPPGKELAGARTPGT